MWIEVFKSGEHKDSSGKLRKFTDDMLDKIATLYNGKVKESSSYEAPLVKGHPKTDDPAYGWIEKLKRKGSTLLAKLKDVSTDMINDVKNGLFKKISIALYPDLMLRHVGLLGATAPAVRGLKPVEFEEDKEYEELITNDELLITNEEGKTEGQNDGRTEGNEKTSFDELRMTDERICELEEENLVLKSKLDGLEKGNRISEYREFVNSLIECESGSVLTSAQGEELVDILILVDSNDFEFNERPNVGMTEGPKDKLVDRIKSLFDGMKPRVSGMLYSDSFKGDSRRQTSDGKINDAYDFSDSNTNPERMELHKKALEIQSTNGCLTYEEAVLMALSKL